jgi:hypothetical protein
VVSAPVAAASPGTETDKEPAAEEWETASESSEHGATSRQAGVVIPPLLPDWPQAKSTPADGVLALADLKLTDGASHKTGHDSKDQALANNKTPRTDSHTSTSNSATHAAKK